MGFDPAVDLSRASLFAGWALAAEVQRRLVADGFDDTRFADEVVFQHLMAGPVTISTLAERMSVTQQAASKSVADLEKRGYLSREQDPADARARQVVLSPRGEAVIGASRRHRETLESELRQALGADRVEAARLLLVDAINLLGASPALRAGAVRPPRQAFVSQ